MSKIAAWAADRNVVSPRSELVSFATINFDDLLGKVCAAGGVIETEYREYGPRPAAFCSDPFGNGFCVIGEGESRE